MIRGLYTSGWSMLANTRKMDVITNNLANVNTNAYKKDGVIFQSFPELLTQRIKDTDGNAAIGNMSLGSDVGEIHTYNTPGQFQKTNNNLDFALNDTGNGVSYFAVAVAQPDGNIQEYYTRDGAFTLDSSGRLVNKDGNLVLGQNGAITLNGGDFSVTSGGQIYQGGNQIDTLRVVTFTNPDTLRKVGNNLMATTAESSQTPFTGEVKQGYVEGSNVNVVSEMVDMISVSRAYEASQKALQAQDGTLEKAVNEIGSIK